MNTISTNIRKCKGTGTRLVSEEVTEKQNDYTLENLSKLHQTGLEDEGVRSPVFYPVTHRNI